MWGAKWDTETWEFFKIEIVLQIKNSWKLLDIFDSMYGIVCLVMCDAKVMRQISDDIIQFHAID